MNIGSLSVRIAADIADFESKMSRAQRAFSGLADRVGEIGQRLTTRITVPVAALGTGIVAAAARMDSLQRGLIAVAGSGEEAARQLERLRQVARLPGLGFQEAIEGSVALQAAGFAAETAERALTAFGNALATVGKGKADLQGVQLALSQIASKGKVSAEEINQLSERVPQIRKAMQAAFGTADTEKLQRMGIGAERFIAGIITELEKLPPVTGGVANAFENVADAGFRAAASLGRTLIPVIERITDRLAAFFERVEAMDPATVRWRISLVAVAAALGPLAIAISTVTTALVALSTALSIGLLPLVITGGALLVGLGVLAARFISNKLAVESFSDQVARLRGQLANLNAEQTLAEFLGTDQLMQELKARERLLVEQAQRERDAWMRVHGAPAPWDKDAGVSKETKRQLEETREQIAQLEPRLEALSQQYLELAKAQKAASGGGPPTPPDLGAEERRVDALIKAVELNIASNEHVNELMRKYDEFNRIAFDATKPLEEQVAAFERMNEILDAMRANLRDMPEFDVTKSMRKRLPQLRLPSAGTVRADGGADPGFMSGIERSLNDLASSIGSSLKQMFDPKMFLTGLATSAVSALSSQAIAMFSGLFSKSPAEREREQLTRQNTEALERLRAGIAELGAAIGAAPGRSFGALSQAVSNTLGADFDSFEEDPGKLTGRFRRELSKLGLTMSEAEKIAEGLGIQLDFKNLKRGFDSLEALQEALREVEFSDLFNTVGGQLERLQQTFKIFGTNQQGQLIRLRDFFIEAANLPAAIEQNLASFDLSTAEGLQGFRQLLSQIFAGMESFGFEGLGELSADEFVDLLLQMSGLTDSLGKLGDAADKAAGALRNVPTGFKYALAAFNATQGVPLNDTALAGGVRMLRGETIYIDQVDVHGVEDPGDFYEKMRREATDRKRAGGVVELV